jgi:hypothetical protein
MATIDDIVTAIERIPIANDGSLTLAASDFSGIAIMESFFASILHAQSYTLRGARRTPGAETITVGGQGDVAGYVGIGVTVTCAVGDRGVTVTITGSVSAGDPRPLPVVSWIEVAEIDFTATIAEPLAIVTYGYGASIVPSGGGTIPMSLAENGDGEWAVTVAGDATHPVTVEQLVELIGGHGLEQFLPPDLIRALQGLELTELQITFDPAARTVSQVSAGLTVTNGWTPVDGISLQPGLHLGLLVANPTDDVSRAFDAVVTGTFTLDGVDVPCFVQVDVSGGTSTWQVGLDPSSGGVTLPSLSGLFTLAGGRDFTNSLPPALARLPGIRIDPLLIAFTLGPAALQRFDFGAATTEPWPIIDGFLTVEQLSFNLALAGLDTPRRTVGGGLTCAFDVTRDVALYFACVKDPAAAVWTFRGGLAPGKSLNVTDLVARLLSAHVAIPPSAPQLVLDTVDLTVVPGATMTFVAGSRTPWALLAGLSLDAFTLRFTYVDSSPRPFTGSLDTSLTVARVPLEISAGLDTSGAWSFSGGTRPGASIDVTALVNDLATTFRVPAIPADALGGLTIADLSVSFATAAADKPGRFHFSCDGSFRIADTELDILVAIDLTSAATGYTGTFTGQLKLVKDDRTTEEIDVTFVGGTLTADWRAAPGHGLSLTDLASCFGFGDLPALPSALDLTLQSMVFRYDVPTASLSIGATTASGDRALFVTAPVGPERDAERRFAFAVDLPLNVTLADLPLVGDRIPSASQLGIPEIGAWALSGDLAGSGATSGAAALNRQVPTGYPQLPETPQVAGLLLFGTLLLGADKVPLELPVGGAPARAPPPRTLAAHAPAPAAAPGAAVAKVSATPPAAPTTKWFSVQRSFGVFTFARVGVQYDGGSGTLFFLLDASIELGPLELTTQGLGIGSPLTDFEPKFHLDGLGLSYDQPPLEISGGFLAVPAEQLAPDVAYQYDGFAVIRASGFSLAAIGSYAQMKPGDPSLFLFAQLEAPLGGPPVFFVTGLMAGFGYNRMIRLPEQDELLRFPLLVLGRPPAPGRVAPPVKRDDVLALLEGTAPGGDGHAWIEPKTGDYWLAVGVEFTSFELVTTRAMLIAQFGHDLAFALLGISTLRLPQGVPDAETYAYVELELAAVLKPNEGVFGLTAVLGPASYVISPDCHLTGGFAFFVWFGENPNAGQFVITLGGYHPAFRPPPYFPAEPRLGFNWTIGETVTVKGDAYFALTASCVMAGGGLEIVFQSGNLRAWFTAHMDVLISWHPFFFVAEIGVGIGVSYKLDLGFICKTLTIELGADLSLWGPPTGGTVTVHLWIISFTVDIGAPQGSAADTPLDPGGFAALLPAAPTQVTVAAGTGLTKTLDDRTWVVRASAFAFTTGSAIPATTLTYGGPRGTDVTKATGFALAVRPMDLATTEATHTVRIARADRSDPQDLSAWAPSVVRRAVPESLWGAPHVDRDGRFTQLPPQATAKTVPDAPVGGTFTCPAPVLGPSTGSVPEDELAFEPVSAPGANAVDAQSPLAVGVQPDATGLPRALATSPRLIAQIASVAARAPIVAALGAAVADGRPLYGGPSSDLAALGAAAGHEFTDAPLVVGVAS